MLWLASMLAALASCLLLHATLQPAQPPCVLAPHQHCRWKAAGQWSQHSRSPPSRQLSQVSWLVALPLLRTSRTNFRLLFSTSSDFGGANRVWICCKVTERFLAAADRDGLCAAGNMAGFFIEPKERQPEASITGNTATKLHEQHDNRPH